MGDDSATMAAGRDLPRGVLGRDLDSATGPDPEHSFGGVGESRTGFRPSDSTIRTQLAPPAFDLRAELAADDRFAAALLAAVDPSGQLDPVAAGVGIRGGLQLARDFAASDFGVPPAARGPGILGDLTEQLDALESAVDDFDRALWDSFWDAAAEHFAPDLAGPAAALTHSLRYGAQSVELPEGYRAVPSPRSQVR